MKGGAVGTVFARDEFEMNHVEVGGRMVIGMFEAVAMLVERPEK